LTGVTATDTNVAAVTVNVAVPAFPVAGSAAVTVTGPPMAFEVAIPLKTAVLSMVATVSSEDVQITDEVRSCVVRSEYVPVAVNGCFVPRVILRLTGVISMDTNFAAVTVSFAVPVFPDGSAAVIVTGPPMAFEVATPFEPAELLTLATDASEDVHVTDDVRSCVVRSEYVPVAVNGCFVPRAILLLTGVTPTDTSVAAVTVSFAVPVFPVTGSAAVTVTGPPMDSEVATPFEPAVLLTAATDTFEEVHVTDEVRSCVVRSEYVPVAINC